MATYFTDDFADFATDWTERYNTAGTWSVSSGDLTVSGGATTDWRVLSWNDIDGDANRDNIELLFLLTTGTSLGTNLYMAVVRGSGADETATHYAAMISSSALRVYYCNGSDTPTQVATVAATFSTSTDYWFRFRVNGTAIKLRAWADGGSEPGTWDIDTTDSTVSGTGWAGPGIYGAPAVPVWKQFGVGTNGDTAPNSSGSTATGTASLTLAAMGLSAAATADVAASAAASLAAITANASAAVDVNASAALAIAALSVTAAAEVPVVGSSSPTLAAIGLSASATVGAVALGDLAQTLGGIGLSAAGAADVAGSSSSTLAAIGITATAEVPVVGTATPSLAAIALSATAATTTISIGTLDVALAPATLASSGAVAVAAVGAAQIGASVSAAAEALVAAAGAAAIAHVTLVAAAYEVVPGVYESTPQAQAGPGVMGDPRVGAAAGAAPSPRIGGELGKWPNGRIG